MYPPELVQPMRDEVTSLGVQELRTPEQVDELLAKEKGTTLLFVNSVCGCAAGAARPALGIALQSDSRPDQVATVFAGADPEATAKARTYLDPYTPSSPSFALLRDGKVLKMIERHEIEGRHPSEIASSLMSLFNEYCGTKAASEK